MYSVRRIAAIGGIVASLVLSGAANADVSLPHVISDHMVLQRGEAVPVWGWADAGAAVTVELLGPLGLAAGLSRRLRDLGCVALALAGVVLLGWGGEHLDTFGLVLAVAAAGGWASYIMLSRSAGKASDGMGSLGLAMALAAVLVAPFGLAPGSALLRPNVMALGTVVAVLGALVPFSLELTALRHVPPRVFGVLMSLSPVAAVLSGWLLLGQDLTLRDAVAMVMVMAASLITVRTAENRPSARTRTRA